MIHAGARRHQVSVVVLWIVCRLTLWPAVGLLVYSALAIAASALELGAGTLSYAYVLVPLGLVLGSLSLAASHRIAKAIHHHDRPRTRRVWEWRYICVLLAAAVLTYAASSAPATHELQDILNKALSPPPTAHPIPAISVMVTAFVMALAAVLKAIVLLIQACADYIRTNQRPPVHEEATIAPPSPSL